MVSAVGEVSRCLGPLSVENSWTVARIGRNAAYTAEVFRPCRGGFGYICATAARAPRRPPQSPCPLVKERSGDPAPAEESPCPNQTETLGAASPAPPSPPPRPATHW